jgi:threonine dehydrogenase-like Zn-dependent dehydrogenase
VGRVAAVGAEVTRWQPGDAVVGGPTVRCGSCVMCRAGRPSLCAERDTPGIGPEQGAFATYKATDADALLALPEGLAPRAAALAEPLAVALHGIHQGGIEPGGRVLVLGAGPIGALSIAALRALGVDDVRCAEPSAPRQALAAAVGATTVVHPADLVVPSIAEPGLVVDDAVDVVLECSGKAKAMEAGLAQLVRGGTLVLVGAGIEAPRFDPNRILLNELIVTGSFTYDQGGFDEALGLLASGALPVDALLEPDEVGLDGLLDAMRDLSEGRRAGKVLVRP